VNPRDLLLGACLLCAVVASIALVRAAEWTRAHWVLVILLAVACLMFPMWLWHRRQMIYYREQWATGEGWEKVPAWARREMWACPHCKCLLASLDDAEGHMDPEESACAAYRKHLEDRQDAKQEQTYVDVLNTPGRGWPAVLPDQEEAE